MSIADKITRLQNAKSAIAAAIATKGGTVGSGDGFEDFATDIGTITTGVDPSDATALAANIMSGYTAYIADGTKATGTLAEYDGTTTEPVTGLLPIGGRIFYVHPLDTGATYEFYTEDEERITDITVAGLANAVYYKVNGTPSVDKFYVVDVADHVAYFNNETYQITGGVCRSPEWGYYNTLVDTTIGTSIGTGKPNTTKVMNKGVPTDRTPNIWQYLEYCRNSSFNEHNDWYFGSKEEMEQLRLSGIVSFSNKFWTSSEDWSNVWVYWDKWSEYAKNNNFRCILIRSF